MNKKVLFSDLNQIEVCKNQIIDTTNTKLKEIWGSGDGIEFLKKVKFEKCGFDPLFEESANFIEQINQTFTYLICLSAVEILLKRFPKKKFYVNFGTESGYDVISEDETIICECFAATAPDSNSKLEKDTAKVYRNQKATHRFVIFYAEIAKHKHVDNIRTKYGSVEILSLENLI